MRIELTFLNLQFIVFPLYDPNFGYNLMVKMTNFQFVNAGSSPATRKINKKETTIGWDIITLLWFLKIKMNILPIFYSLFFPLLVLFQILLYFLEVILYR